MEQYWHNVVFYGYYINSGYVCYINQTFTTKYDSNDEDDIRFFSPSTVLFFQFDNEEDAFYFKLKYGEYII